MLVLISIRKMLQNRRRLDVLQPPACVLDAFPDGTHIISLVGISIFFFPSVSLRPQIPPLLFQKNKAVTTPSVIGCHRIPMATPPLRAMDPRRQVPNLIVLRRVPWLPRHRVPWLLAAGCPTSKSSTAPQPLGGRWRPPPRRLVPRASCCRPPLRGPSPT
jgi:hypothetical protein